VSQRGGYRDLTARQMQELADRAAARTATRVLMGQASAQTAANAPRIVTPDALEKPHAALPHDFGPDNTEGDEGPENVAQDDGTSIGKQFDYQEALNLYLAGRAMTLKTRAPARSADFFANITWLEYGLDFARVELYALQGSTRSLVTTGTMTGGGNLGPPGLGPVSTLGLWLAAGRAATPVFWEARFYFAIHSTITPRVGYPASNIQLAGDLRILPQPPASLGGINIFSGTSRVGFPHDSGAVGAGFQGASAPIRLVRYSGMNVANAAVLYLQYQACRGNTGGIPGPADFELALQPNAGAATIHSTDLEELTYRNNGPFPVNNGSIVVSTIEGTCGLGTIAANGSTWWSLTWK